VASLLLLLPHVGDAGFDGRLAPHFTVARHASVADSAWTDNEWPCDADQRNGVLFRLRRLSAFGSGTNTERSCMHKVSFIKVIKIPWCFQHLNLNSRKYGDSHPNCQSEKIMFFFLHVHM